MNVRILLYALLASILALAWSASCVIYYAAEVGELVAPIEPRHFDRLSVITVGTGCAVENPERLGPVIAVGFGDRIWLIDAGRGVAEALRRARIPLAQPEGVLLTSLLPENTAGLDDLVATGWLAGRDRPLRLIGPAGTDDLWRGLVSAGRTGLEARQRALGLPRDGFRIDALEVEGGWRDESDGLALRAGSLHGGPLPSLGWRFEARDRSVVVTGTGWAPDDLVEFAEGANMWLHEAAYFPSRQEIEEMELDVDPLRLEREAALHTSVLDVGALAERADVDKLVLVRMRPPPFFDLQVTSEVSKSYTGSIAIPEDGDELTP